MPAFSISAYRAEDLEGIVGLLRVELPLEPITLASFARKVLLDPNFDPAGAFVARDTDGKPRGFLLALRRRRPLEDGPDDRDRGWITLFAVAASARRQGIGSGLLQAAERWLREGACTTVWISTYAPHYWTPGVDEAAYPLGLAFLQHRGYATMMRPLSMEAALVEGWKTPAWAVERAAGLPEAGIRIERFSPHRILPLTDFLRAEFPGDWQRFLRETMLDIIAERRPAEELLLAVLDERILGFAQSEGTRFGPFGVAKEARGRGLGAVLLFEALEGMRARGRRSAWFLWTNDALADRLYRAAGFQETRRYAVLKKPLG